MKQTTEEAQFTLIETSEEIQFHFKVAYISPFLTPDLRNTLAQKFQETPEKWLVLYMPKSDWIESTGIGNCGELFKMKGEKKFRIICNQKIGEAFEIVGLFEVLNVQIQS